MPACPPAGPPQYYAAMPAPVSNPPVRPVPRAPSYASARTPGFFAGLRQHGFLISQLTRREVVGRYRSSHLGIVWSFVNPLLLLCIYTVVFRYIFDARFTGHPEEGWADFALMLFSALVVFNVFAECLGRAPSLILMNTNYVTKVVFPLELLPLTVVLGSLVHLLIGFVPLVLATLVSRSGHLHATVLLWPLLLVTVTLWALAAAWFVSVLGAFLRDLKEVMAAVIQILMYASAVSYPLSRVPAGLRNVLQFNPLAFICEQSRNLVVWGEGLDWSGYALVTLAGLVAAAGHKFFVNVKPAFADVI